MTSRVLNTMGPSMIIEEFTLSAVTDVNAAATGQTVNLKTLPKGSFVFGAIVKHDVAFAGGSISAATVSVGSLTGPAATAYLAAKDIFAAVAATTIYPSDTKGIDVITSDADTVTAVFASTGGNLSTLTAGRVRIILVYCIVSDMTGVGPVGNQVAAQGGF